MTSSSIVFIFAFLAVVMTVLGIEQAPDSMEVVDRQSEEIVTNKRPSFFVGSRYGRSYYGNSKAGRVNVVPRNDRFFLGSRYGKRNNNDYSSAKDSEQQQPHDINSDWSSSNRSKFFAMSCIHTGFKNFFRCNSVNDINNYVQYLTNDEQ